MNKIAINAIKSGSMTTLNAPEDVRLAEELLKIHLGLIQLKTRREVKVCQLLW